MAEAVTETQTADTLTKGPSPFSLSAPESPEKPAASLPDTLEARSKFYDEELKKIIGDLGAKTAVADKGIAEAESQYGQTVENVVKPAMARAKEQYDKPGPPLPTQLPTPPQPDISARPFNASHKEALGSVVQTLGLMAQMAFGAGKAPKAALGAFTGAMQGWAEGDSIRAERDWKSYLGAVDTIRQENRQALLMWDAASRQHGQNEQAATAALSVSLAEAGFAKDAIAVAEKGRTRALQDFAAQKQQIDDLWQRSLQMEKIRVQSEFTRESRAYRMQHDKEVAEATERRDRENREERRRAADQSHADRVDALRARHTEGLSAAGQFTPESLEYMAQQYYATGILPPMGMGKASTEARIQIMNRAADIAAKAGTTPADQVARGQFAKGTQNELSALMRQRGAVMAFASTADQNLDAALGLSAKVDRSGVPVINRWILAGQKEVAGDPDVTQFNIYNNRAVTEIARLTSSAGGSGQATDTARREAEELLKTAFTPEQYKAAVDALKQEVTFRRKGYEDQIQATQDAVKKLTSGGQAAPQSIVPPAPKPGMVRVKRKSDGMTGWLDEKDLGDLYEVVK